MLLPYVLADVIANDLVEDVKPHIFVWTVCNKCVGWCYCLWQMEWPLQSELSLWQMLLPRVLILLQFEFWGVKQNLIPDMRQMEFAYVFIEGWMIDPYVQCFFDSSAEVLVLPPYDVEIINGDLMTSDVAMVINWWGGLLMLFKPLSKWSWGFTNVFLITFNPATLISIDDPTLFQDWILILGGHQEALMVCPPLK